MLTAADDDAFAFSGKRVVIVLLCAWVCLLAAYFLFAGEVSGEEAVAGAACAAVAVLWWAAIRRRSSHRLAFGSGCWAVATRALRRLPGSTISTAAILLRGQGGRKAGGVIRWSFAHGRRADPDDGGRRAVGVLAASLAPDSFVLRTPSDRAEIVLHALLAPEPPKDPRWPI